MIERERKRKRERQREGKRERERQRERARARAHTRARDRERERERASAHAREQCVPKTTQKPVTCAYMFSMRLCKLRASPDLFICARICGAQVESLGMGRMEGGKRRPCWEGLGRLPPRCQQVDPDFGAAPNDI